MIVCVDCFLAVPLVADDRCAQCHPRYLRRAENGRRSAAIVLADRGPDHYAEMGRKGVESRRLYGESPSSREPKIPAPCGTCAQRPTYAHKECTRCYLYRRRHGVPRPIDLSGLTGFAGNPERARAAGQKSKRTSKLGE